MKKVIITIITVVLCVGVFALFRFGPIRSGTSPGDGSMWPGLVEIKTARRTVRSDQTVNFTLSYGHAYKGDASEHGVLRHHLVVSIEGHDDEIILHEIDITGDDLLSEDYLCDPGQWIFSRVSYEAAFDLDLDFGSYDIAYGRIIVTFYETAIMEDNVDGEIVQTEITHDNRTFLWFRNDGKTIRFSNRSF
jgi:hypothetical protein